MRVLASASTIRSVTKPAQCRYDACVESPEGEVLTGDPQRKVIPGGKYAALAFARHRRGNRRGLGLPAARLAAEERPAARCAAVLRALPGRWALRPEDRRVHLRHLRARRAVVTVPGGKPGKPLRCHLERGVAAARYCGRLTGNVAGTPASPPAWSRA